MKIKDIKYKIYKIIHDYPIEIYMMWIILILFIVCTILKIYYKLTNYSATYQFIMNL